MSRTEDSDPATAETLVTDNDGLERDQQPLNGANTPVGWPSPRPSGTSPPDQWLASSSDGQRRLVERPDSIEGQITSADLLNPSDALDLLAQVADLDAKRQENSTPSGSVNRHSNSQQSGASDVNGSTYYPPIAEGMLSLSDASILIDQ